MDPGWIRQEIADARGLIADLMTKLQTVDGWLGQLAGRLGT